MKKQIRKMKEVGFNRCPHCGKEAFLFTNEVGKYNVGCMSCEDASLDTYLVSVDAEEEIARVRLQWNLWCLTDRYTSQALESMGICNQDYVAVSSQDARIVYHGTLEEVVTYIEKTMTESDEYIIYCMVYGKLYALESAPFLIYHKRDFLNN